MATGQFVGANTIQFTVKKYGTEFNDAVFTIDFTAKVGEEKIEATTPITYSATNVPSGDGEYTISLAAGKEYTAADIEEILKKGGFDFEVTLSGATPDEPNTLMATTGGATAVEITMGDTTAGAGLGSAAALWNQDGYGTVSSGGGITLQIGANEGQTMQFSMDDMSARALGVDGNKIDISTQEGAQKATTTVDEAIKKVSA